MADAKVSGKRANAGDPQFTVEVVPLTAFQPDPENLNQHTERGMGLLEESLAKRGFARPMFASGDGVMLAGNATQEKALEVGYDKAIVVTTHGDVPIIHRRSDLKANDPDARLLALADNRIAEVNLATDLSGLQALSRVLMDAGKTADFERLYTARDMEALVEAANANHAGESEPEPPLPADAAELLQAKWQVQMGDLWEAGAHRLLCADSTDAGAVAALFGRDLAQLVWTDPPYGIDYVGKQENSEPLTIQNDHLAGMVSLVRAALTNACVHCTPSASVYVSVPSGYLMPPMISAFEDSGFVFHLGLVWVKDSMVLGRGDYHMKHEMILYGWRKGESHYFTADRTQTSVFEFARPKDSELHPTMKPPPLIAAMIRNSSVDDQIVYDPFMGSGSTLIACQQTGRRGRGIELEPKYVAATLERLAGLGLEPRRIACYGIPLPNELAAMAGTAA